MPTHAYALGSYVFKHYQVRSLLGEGGCGQVFKAWDSNLCREVALKRLNDEGGAADLIREARLGASLRHPAFVKVFAVEDDGDSQSIVMELIHGRTLRQLLSAGPLDAPRALAIVAQIAHAMEEAHAQHLVHGDLKPSNVMLDSAGLVRILDFGLAMQVDSEATCTSPTGEPQGTLAYMAPERLSGAAQTASADIYALGTLLYELLTGVRPFAGLHGLALAAALCQSSSADWDYPPALRREHIVLIRAMTARCPEQRLASMRMLQERVGPQTADAFRPRVLRRLGAWCLAALLTTGATVSWNDAAPSARSAPPYSVAVHMADGLAALALPDVPGKLDEASAQFAAVLDREPRHAAAVAGMSIVYSRRQQSDAQDEVWLMKASAAAQQATRLNPQLALAHAADAIALERSGKSALALAAADLSLRLEPTNLFAMLSKAATLARQGQVDAALTMAQAGLRAHPRERSFADLIGKIHYDLGEYAAAERAFRTSIRIQPDVVDAYANLNAVLQRQGRGDEALAVLQQGLQVRPNAWLYGNLGNALFSRGDYIGAVAAFENAVCPVKGNPGDYLGWANLADTLLWIPGRREEAAQAYRKAMALLAAPLARAPGDVTLVSRMALYRARSGDSAGALPAIEHALRLAPDSLDVQFRAGLAYELIGQRDRAITAILRALGLGYPRHAIEIEPDLLALRRDARFPQLSARLAGS
jgi:tetratricopeptide (TPR) repeat protein/predicted Ser/Thr protein kinase